MVQWLAFIRSNTSILLRVFVLPILVLIIGMFLLEVLRLDLVIKDLDKPVHFIAGASLALSLIILIKNLETSDLVKSRTILANLFGIFMIVVTVVLLWECFEFTLDTLLGTNYQDSAPDTQLDILSSLAGGIIPLLFYSLIRVKVAFVKQR